MGWHEGAREECNVSSIRAKEIDDFSFELAVKYDAAAHSPCDVDTRIMTAGDESAKLTEYQSQLTLHALPRADQSAGFVFTSREAVSMSEEMLIFCPKLSTPHHCSWQR
jgi:hypothetical protein